MNSKIGRMKITDIKPKNRKTNIWLITIIGFILCAGVMVMFIGFPDLLNKKQLINIQYLEDNQLIFLFVDLLEKADDAAYELIDFAIDAFKRMSMYESAYFYYLVKKAHTQIACDDYEQLSMLQMISASQRKEVEQDLLIYLKNRLILNKYSNLL